jgi:hypothetical protein
MRYGKSTNLAVIHFTFNKEGFNSTLSQSFSSTGSRWASSDHSNTKRSVKRGSVLDSIHLHGQTTASYLLNLVGGLRDEGIAAVANNWGSHEERCLLVDI